MPPFLQPGGAPPSFPAKSAKPKGKKKKKGKPRRNAKADKQLVSDIFK